MKRATLLVAGAVALPALLPLPAVASFPGDNGRIAVHGQYDEGQDEYTTWVDLIQPDDGERESLLTDYNPNSQDEYGPHGPADGEFVPGLQRLLFLDVKDFSTDEVWRVSTDGTKTVSPSAEEGPMAYSTGPIAPSPDGTRFAFSRYGKLRVANYDGSAVSAVRKGFWAVAWAPNGRSILARKGRDFWSVPLNGDRPKRLTRMGTDSEGLEVGSVAGGDFSPDGRRIVFRFYAYANEEPLDGVYTMKADGTDVEKLPFDSTSPTWSPDGEYITYVKAQADTQTLYRSRPDGSEEVPITVLTTSDDNYYSVLDWEGLCTITGEEDGHDLLVGTPGDDVICGLGGHDDIRGGGGDDVLFGGDGNDELSGAYGNDVLNGGAGSDVLLGHAGTDLLSDIFGTDKLHGGWGSDHVYALDSGRRDTARGGGGRDRCWSNRIDAVSCENHGYGE